MIVRERLQHRLQQWLSIQVLTFRNLEFVRFVYETQMTICAKGWVERPSTVIAEKAISRKP
jgi:hypothetical protein